jgi:hypothetical protein
MPRLGLGIQEFGWESIGASGEKRVDPMAKPWDDDRENGSIMRRR